jgi:hypothetical protein
LDVRKLLPLLGAAVTDRSIIDAFLELHVDLRSDLVVTDGTSHADIERKPDGIGFSFRNDVREDRVYVLEGIFLYAGGKDGYAEFEGVIPTGISFTSSRDDIVRLLGPADWRRRRSDESVAAERWEMAPRFMHVTYSRETMRPRVIVFGAQALLPLGMLLTPP